VRRGRRAAVAVEEAVAHPEQPFAAQARVALAAGLALFLGAMAIAIWRATRHRLLARLGVALATAAAITLLSSVAPAVTPGVAFAGVAALCVWEQRSASLAHASALPPQVTAPVAAGDRRVHSH
jgi:hypothetical protein